MSGYQERAVRVDAKFPVEFVVSGKSIRGACENLSETGLLARFAEQLDIWIDGEVHLHFGTHLLGVKVRVARVVGLQAGLVFRHSDDQQRLEIRDLIRAARNDGALTEHL